MTDDERARELLIDVRERHAAKVLAIADYYGERANHRAAIGLPADLAVEIEAELRRLAQWLKEGGL